MTNGIIHALGYLLIALVCGLFTLFIVLNILVGCEDWSQQICITPMQMMELILP